MGTIESQMIGLPVRRTSPLRPLRFLYVGQLSAGGTCLQRLQALTDLGHQVDAISITSRAPSNPILRVWARAWHRLGRPVDAAGVNREILHKLSATTDVLWLDKTLMVHPETLQTIKHRFPNTIVAGYSPDDMGGKHNQSHYFLQSLPYYDVYFTTKSYNVAELIALGCPRVVFVPKSFDPRTHYPEPLLESHRRTLGAPIGFIGTYEHSRANSIAMLVKHDVPVKVYGDRWDSVNNVAGLTIAGPSTYGADYRRIICSFDINLCFLRKLNRDLQTARSVEIPACGAFMLAERTDEHLALFTEDEEAVYFGDDFELIDKARFYLDHPEQRRKIAAKGRDRCLASGYSHQSRLEAVTLHLHNLQSTRTA